MHSKKATSSRIKGVFVVSLTSHSPKDHISDELADALQELVLAHPALDPPHFHAALRRRHKKESQ
jgi:hypothetical protein